MGCAASKLDNLPAVALCRDRCKFLDQALFLINALIHSHSAYADSLKNLASALHRLFDQDASDLKISSPPPVPSIDPSPSASESDSNSESDDEDALFHKSHSSPIENFMFSNYDSGREQLPPPPLPPTGSSWDFSHFFETYERYEPILNFYREEGGDAKPKTTGVTAKKKKKKKRTVVVDSKNNEDGKKLNQPEKKRDDSKMGVFDVMREIKGSFEKASESSNSISKLLSFGQRMNFCNKDAKMGSRGLLSTLKKLCVWEQKLYLEVKAEERLRMILEKKCRQLKNLVEKKADARKVDSLRTLIGNLSINLKVSIQVVDRISITISKLRDEEFLEEITELIHGLESMWKGMLECHKHQTQALTEPKASESGLNGILDDAHLEAAMDLKVVVENWRANLCNLITTQKELIKALNGWLLRCLLYEPEPEETPNSTCPPPFSPARIGAPPVFVISHLCSATVEKFSETDVSEAMQEVVLYLDGALEQQSEDLQRLGLVKVNRDLEKKKIKSKRGLKEKTVAVLVTAEILHKTAGKFSGCEVKLGLKQIFLALTRFCGDSVQAYEELCSTMEESCQMSEKQEEQSQVPS